MPTVGVIDYPDDFKTVTMADVPGLIEGAAENRGLGHRFLRHIERCRLILFLLDLAGTDGRTPIEDFLHLQKELQDYDEKLVQKEFIIVGNKIDEENGKKNIDEFRIRFPDREIFSISAILEDGLDELKAHLLSHFS